MPSGKVLAVDCSSGRGSIAALEGNRSVFEESWSTDDSPGEPFFEKLSVTPARAGWRWEEINLLAVGRGPGRYSGLRVSMAAITALALPDRQRVRAVSSGEALAWSAAREWNTPALTAVVGDARRGVLWYGIFEPCRNAQATGPVWKTALAADLAAGLPDGTLVISPDADRLRNVFAAFPRRRLCVIDRPLFPSAADVARLAAAREAAGAPEEPLLPCYSHPAARPPRAL